MPGNFGAHIVVVSWRGVVGGVVVIVVDAGDIVVSFAAAIGDIVASFAVAIGDIVASFAAAIGDIVVSFAAAIGDIRLLNLFLANKRNCCICRSRLLHAGGGDGESGYSLM